VELQILLHARATKNVADPLRELRISPFEQGNHLRVGFLHSNVLRSNFELPETCHSPRISTTAISSRNNFFLHYCDSRLLRISQCTIALMTNGRKVGIEGRVLKMLVFLLGGALVGLILLVLIAARSMWQALLVAAVGGLVEALVSASIGKDGAVQEAIQTTTDTLTHNPPNALIASALFGCAAVLMVGLRLKRRP
jgi:hypothetical protein